MASAQIAVGDGVGQETSDNHDDGFDPAWLDKSVAALPALKAFPRLRDDACKALRSWRERLDKNTWRRLFKSGGRDARAQGIKERVLKELNECAPVLVAIRDVVEGWASKLSSEDQETKRITIVDLCSGFGILSMFLSEMLPKQYVEAIVLVDKMWPPHSQLEPGPTQMSWRHLRAEGWPIPLIRRKQNIRSSRETKQLKKYVFARAAAKGPVLMCAIHLCGTLSVKAVQLFNTDPNVGLMLLKPCCLPGRKAAVQELVWQLNEHRFTAKHLYRPREERYEDSADQGAQQEGQHKALKKEGKDKVREKGSGDGHESQRRGWRYDEWCEHMRKGADAPELEASACTQLLPGLGEQDTFVVCTRPPFQGVRLPGPDDAPHVAPATTAGGAVGQD